MTLLHDAVAWQAFRTETEARPDALLVLERAATAALGLSRLTVVDKPVVAPSGDPGDYVSQAPYWWPDPSKPDGLPYVRRDGETNPEFHTGDRTTLESLHGAVAALILHGLVTGARPAARQAGRLLRQWFLDPATRMNPHLRYAQRIPGICDGRGIGIIDTVVLCYLVDELGMLESNEDWTPGHQAGVRAWFSGYLDWLLDSEAGRQEGREHNNHGTWYDAQVACFAVFCGREDVARRQIEQVSAGRMDRHFAANGSQPHELARTRSLSYSTFNLLGFACLAQLGRRLGIDLWSRRASSGASLVTAIRWMLPYYLGSAPWTWPQIVPFKPSQAALLLSLAAQGTGVPEFAPACDALTVNPWERVCAWSPGIAT